MKQALHDDSSTARTWTRDDLLELAISFAALGAVGRIFSVFARAIERRPGVVLNDPLLAVLTPHDMTGVIFATMYVSVAVALAWLRLRPRAFLLSVRSYAIMVLLRILALSLTPFAPPLQTIPLQDPIVQRIAVGEILTHDLFFSGHTATLCILVFTVRHRTAHLFLTLAAAVVGASVLVQAVHYTIDVVAAPAFAYAAYRLARATASRPAHATWLPAAAVARAGHHADVAANARARVGREVG